MAQMCLVEGPSIPPMPPGDPIVELGPPKEVYEGDCRPLGEGMEPGECIEPTELRVGDWRGPAPGDI